jgi:hypothetical protein
VHKTPEITRLIHENFWLVMAHAFSQPNLSKLLDERFRGEWKYLSKSIYELAEIRADRALLEMATQLRVLNDEQHISDYLRQTKSGPIGMVTQADGGSTELHFRDMTNKVIHASKFEWDPSTPDDPKVICFPNDADQNRWKRAEISLVAFAALIGSLMHEFGSS